MYKNLLPQTICGDYFRKKFTGKDSGTVIFVDIVGFSSLTQSFMESGKTGLEAISDLINQVFEPSLKIVLDNSGDIISFAGDAFTAYFRGEEHELKACASSILIRNYFNSNKIKTSQGIHSLNVRIGISSGEIYRKILKIKTKCLYYFNGVPFIQSALGTKYATPVMIIADERIEEYNLEFKSVGKTRFKSLE
ncbi:MAG: adenylate/guanylate cyclase domain-containing protein, partial [bacterium]|nr:adenylate/guanylate cyclase domain-containing protein [bacterium]